MNEVAAMREGARAMLRSFYTLPEAMLGQMSAAELVGKISAQALVPNEFSHAKGTAVDLVQQVERAAGVCTWQELISICAVSRDLPDFLSRLELMQANAELPYAIHFQALTGGQSLYSRLRGDEPINPAPDTLH